MAARASGLHETSAPGAVSAAHEIPPAGSVDRPRSVRRTVRTRRFWILFAGAAAIGVFDEGVLQAFIPNAVSAGVRAERGRGGARDPVAHLRRGAGRRRMVVGSVRATRRGVGRGGDGRWRGRGGDRAGRRPARRSRSPGSRSTGSAPARRSPFARRRSATSSAAPTSGRSSGFSRWPTRSAASSPSISARPCFDATGSYAGLVPVVLASLAVWAMSLWVAGPRRTRTAFVTA